MSQPVIPAPYQVRGKLGPESSTEKPDSGSSPEHHAVQGKLRMTNKGKTFLNRYISEGNWMNNELQIYKT